ncbi:MAG TPA: DNA internalization-related competence protein ComEC/Rec2 [Clostridiaceae bacterium]|nr:DNA internalization-related competence protein ComEC/Rec2 [Clostridiaceae bacterium]
MKFVFRQRIIALLFNAERYGLKFSCLLLCLISYFTRDYLVLCMIIILFCSLFFIIAYSYISQKNKLFYFGLLCLLFIQMWRIADDISQTQDIRKNVGKTVYLELTSQQTLFQTDKGGEFKIFQSQNSTKFAVWLTDEQRYWHKISGYFRPEVAQEARNPGGFNQKAYLANYNCHAVLDMKDSSNSIDQIIIKKPLIDRNKLLIDFRNYLSSRFDAKTVNFLLSICFGQTETLNSDLKQDFQNLGLSHLLAVSGFHFDLFLIPLSEGFNLKKRNLKIQLFIVLPLIFIYNWLCSYPIGLIRASLIYSFVLLGKYFGLELSRKNILLIVMQLLLLMNPWLIFQSAFQLSFLSGLTIYYYLPYLRKIKIMQKLKLVQSITLSLLIQIFILPFLIKNFGVWQLGVILLGGLLNFPLTVIYLIGLFSFYIFLLYKLIQNVLLMNFILFTLLEEPIGKLFEFINWLISNALNLFSRFARADFWLNLQNDQSSLFTWLVFGTLILGIGLTFARLFNSLLIEKYSVSLTIKQFLPGFLVILLLLFNIFRPQLNWKICFLDVGQGDCCLIITPERDCILIDGGIPGQGYRTIIPALNHYGITKVDYAIISHLDSDHYGGILDLLEIRRIEELIVPDSDNINMNKIERNKSIINNQYLSDICQKNGVKYKKVKQSDILILEPLTAEFEILTPDPLLLRNTQDQNAYSLCFVLEIEDLNVMFTGDLNNLSELNLISKYKFAKIDILKVAHHGSKYSTSEKFLNAVRPELAIISAGKNCYGHPAPELLERLTQHNIKIKRTDLNGAIVLELINNQWHLSTYIE